VDFSLLMSIYHKEKVEYFNRCMQSIWQEQTLKPNEIILVEDGILTDLLYASIAQWQKKIGGKLIIVKLKKNVGLGESLNIGLHHCRYDLVARMDTDDIALSNRFEEQLKIFQHKNIDICSSWISEFDDKEDKMLAIKMVPEHHIEIIKYAKKRNPLNHPAVMYKRSKVEKAGSYRSMLWFEDYYLWIRMILEGATFYNIQKPLVRMRAGGGQIERRSGLKYAMMEFTFQKMLLQLGFIDFAEFIRNITIRFFARIIPKKFLKIFYNKKLRN